VRNTYEYPDEVCGDCEGKVNRHGQDRERVLGVEVIHKKEE
jgi:hypothetical protein